MQSLHIICITLWLTPTSWHAERLKLVIKSTCACKDSIYLVNFSKLYQRSHYSTEMKMNLTKPRWYTSFINTTKTKSCFIVLKEPNDLNSICSKRYELSLLSLFLEKKKNIFLLFILNQKVYSLLKNRFMNNHSNLCIRRLKKIVYEDIQIRSLEPMSKDKNTPMHRHIQRPLISSQKRTPTLPSKVALESWSVN